MSMEGATLVPVFIVSSFLSTSRSRALLYIFQVNKGVLNPAYNFIYVIKYIVTLVDIRVKSPITSNAIVVIFRSIFIGMC